MEQYDISAFQHRPFSQAGSYQRVPSDEGRSKREDSSSQPTRVKNRPRSWSWHIIAHFVSFLWIISSGVLLGLNFKGYVIGPSVWGGGCSHGHCGSRLWNLNASVLENDTAISRALHYDRTDHNALGILQLLAKVHEVWFVLIATALVYDVTMILAKRGGGLPIGHLLTHIEFTDIRNVGNPLLWTSSRSLSQRKTSFVLTVFAVFATLLTILANLMGPASAVLVIPTIQWVETKHLYNRTFAELDSPSQDVGYCLDTMLAAGNFSCAYDSVGKKLDEKAVLDLRMDYETDWNNTLSVTELLSVEASGMNFLINTTNTTDNMVVFTPNALTIGYLAGDLIELADSRKDNDIPPWLENSLALIMNRQGPTLGFTGTCYAGDTSVIDIADDKKVLCIHNLLNSTSETFDAIKCFRLGLGFSPSNNASFFTVANYDGDDDISVNLLFSDKALFLTGSNDFGSECLDKPQACDWDKIFSAPPPPTLCADLPNECVDGTGLTSNLTIMSFSVPITDPSVTKTSRVLCNHASYLRYANYSFEPSQSDNPTQVGRMTGLDANLENQTFASVDLDWILLAWSVDRDGLIEKARPIAQGLSTVIPYVWQERDQTADDATLATQQFNTFWLHSVMLTLSSVTWSYDPSSTCPSTIPGQRCLQTWANRRVWAFGIQSRTAKLGITVLSIGMVCAFARFLLGIFHPNREHNPVELLIAALRHVPQRDFHHVESLPRRSTTHFAKIRYKIFDGSDARPRFLPEHY